MKAPALLLASALQLALNLFDFRRIACGDCEVIDEDCVQHVNECVRRDVHQLSEQGTYPLEEFEGLTSYSQSGCQSRPAVSGRKDLSTNWIGRYDREIE
jgi:hypothetical protein